MANYSFILVVLFVFLIAGTMRSEKEVEIVVVKDTQYIPFNMETNVGASMCKEFCQVGILSSGPKVLPLFGRYVFANRDKWQYYSMSDGYNSIRVPLRYRGKPCMDRNGVDRLYSDDVVFADGYNNSFKVTMYESF